MNLNEVYKQAYYKNKSGTGESKKNRSKTFEGIANAMAEQWGSYIENL